LAGSTEIGPPREPVIVVHSLAQATAALKAADRFQSRNNMACDS